MYVDILDGIIFKITEADRDCEMVSCLLSQPTRSISEEFKYVVSIIKQLDNEILQYTFKKLKSIISNSKLVSYNY